MSQTNLGPGILLAEDDQEIRGLLALVFQLEGFDVYEADDGQRALATFETHRGSIAAVVTDLGLPGMGGIDLIENIRALSPSVAIVGASGFGNDSLRAQVLSSGADAFLCKPFVAGDLVQLIRGLLEQSAQPPHST